MEETAPNLSLRGNPECDRAHKTSSNFHASTAAKSASETAAQRELDQLAKKIDAIDNRSVEVASSRWLRSAPGSRRNRNCRRRIARRTMPDG
jgi:hypothetical protein